MSVWTSAINGEIHAQIMSGQDVLDAIDALHTQAIYNLPESKAAPYVEILGLALDALCDLDAPNMKS